MRDIFIDKFMQSFSEAKRNYITDTLVKMSGDKPTSASEASQRLQSLLNAINNSNSEPISTPFTFNDKDLIYGPVIQGVFRRAAGDAFTLLNALDELSKFNDINRQLYTFFLLKSIEDSINKLEERLDASELISLNKENGFTGAFKIDFKNLGLYESMSNSNLIFDFFTSKRLAADEIFDSTNGVAGYLPKIRSHKVGISDVYLKYPETSVSELTPNLTYDGSSIDNLIDTEINGVATFYAPIIMANQEVVGGAKQRIVFELSGICSISSVVIEPIGKYPCYIESIQYDNTLSVVPAFGQDVVLNDSTSFDRRIESKTIIDFERVRATHVHITFVQDTYAYVSVNSDESGVVRYSNYNYSNTTQNQYKEMSEIVAPAATSNATSKPYYKYEFGFTSISIYDNYYNDTGYYISPEYELTNCLMLGIDRNFTTKTPQSVWNYSVEHKVSMVVQPEQSAPIGITTSLMPTGSQYVVEKVKMVGTSGKLEFPIDAAGDVTNVYMDDAAATYTVDLANNKISVNGYVVGSVITAVYVPLFIKFPHKRYVFDSSSNVVEDIENSGAVGIDENFSLVFYNSKNTVKIRHRALLRSFNNDLVRLNSADLLYSLQDPNKYRGI